MKLYTTPPPILTLVTWVPQSKLAFGQTPHIGWPSGLRPDSQTESYSVQPRLPLAATIGPQREFFFIETHPLCLIVGP